MMFFIEVFGMSMCTASAFFMLRGFASSLDGNPKEAGESFKAQKICLTIGGICLLVQLALKFL